MGRSGQLAVSQQTGERIAEQAGFSGLPVDPFQIAKFHSICVTTKGHTRGVAAMLIRHGNNFAISYSALGNDGFERFSVAHELGHYFLDGHLDQLLLNSNRSALRENYDSRDLIEQEADSFAAGLLMPRKWFSAEMDKYEQPSLGVIRCIATKCVTSLTATALRYAELSEDAVATILSSNGKIECAILSNTMSDVKGITRFLHGHPIPPNSATARLCASMNFASGSDDGLIELSSWFGGDLSALMEEEAIYLGSSGKVLTFLYCAVVSEDAYNDQDDEETDINSLEW